MSKPLEASNDGDHDDDDGDDCDGIDDEMRLDGMREREKR